MVAGTTNVLWWISQHSTKYWVKLHFQKVSKHEDASFRRYSNVKFIVKLYLSINGYIVQSEPLQNNPDC
jgi:hypothetical protein